MTQPIERLCTIFVGNRNAGTVPQHKLAEAARLAAGNFPGERLMVFDDSTGAVVDPDFSGRSRPCDEPPPEQTGEPESPQLRGRPKLGVIAREVTLLPRHWDWLATRPGSASQTLRRLIDEARKADEIHDRARLAREATYRFIFEIAGNQPGFEEASRALFAGRPADFIAQINAWPEDIRRYADALLARGSNTGEIEPTP